MSRLIWTSAPKRPMYESAPSRRTDAMRNRIHGPLHVDRPSKPDWRIIAAVVLAVVAVVVTQGWLA